MDKATAIQTLATIKPGVNYPTFVMIVEPGLDGKPGEVRFNLNSYFVGMYCAIYFPGCSQPTQVGDHNNKTFVGKLKKDIAKAIERGADVTIEGIRPIKTTMG